MKKKNAAELYSHPPLFPPSISSSEGAEAQLPW